jgi:hypothetical protein
VEMELEPRVEPRVVQASQVELSATHPYMDQLGVLTQSDEMADDSDFAAISDSGMNFSSEDGDDAPTEADDEKSSTRVDQTVCQEAEYPRQSCSSHTQISVLPSFEEVQALHGCVKAAAFGPNSLDKETVRLTSHVRVDEAEAAELLSGATDSDSDVQHLLRTYVENDTIASNDDDFLCDDDNDVLSYIGADDTENLDFAMTDESSSVPPACPMTDVSSTCKRKHPAGDASPLPVRKFARTISGTAGPAPFTQAVSHQKMSVVDIGLSLPRSPGPAETTAMHKRPEPDRLISRAPPFEDAWLHDWMTKLRFTDDKNVVKDLFVRILCAEVQRGRGPESKDVLLRGLMPSAYTQEKLRAYTLDGIGCLVTPKYDGLHTFVLVTESCVFMLHHTFGIFLMYTKENSTVLPIEETARYDAYKKAVMQCAQAGHDKDKDEDKPKHGATSLARDLHTLFECELVYDLLSRTWIVVPVDVILMRGISQSGVFLSERISAISLFVQEVQSLGPMCDFRFETKPFVTARSFANRLLRNVRFDTSPAPAHHVLIREDLFTAEAKGQSQGEGQGLVEAETAGQRQGYSSSQLCDPRTMNPFQSQDAFFHDTRHLFQVDGFIITGDTMGCRERCMKWKYSWTMDFAIYRIPPARAYSNGKAAYIDLFAMSNHPPSYQMDTGKDKDGIYVPVRTCRTRMVSSSGACRLWSEASIILQRGRDACQNVSVIMEMWLNTEKNTWEPLRIRSDKTSPNDVQVLTDSLQRAADSITLAQLADALAGTADVLLSSSTNTMSRATSSKPCMPSKQSNFSNSSNSSSSFSASSSSPHRAPRQLSNRLSSFEPNLNASTSGSTYMLDPTGRNSQQSTSAHSAHSRDGDRRRDAPRGGGVASEGVGGCGGSGDGGGGSVSGRDGRNRRERGDPHQSGRPPMHAHGRVKGSGGAGGRGRGHGRGRGRGGGGGGGHGHGHRR